MILVDLSRAFDRRELKQYNMLVETITFKEWIFEKFLEWEKRQPGKRSSYSKFAEWLSQNSFDTLFKQQSIHAWKEGEYEPSEKYLPALAEKLGNEVYDALQIPRPNEHLQRVNKYWQHLPEEIQRQIADQAEGYGTRNERELDDENQAESRSPGKI